MYEIKLISFARRRWYDVAMIRMWSHTEGLING